MMIDPDYKKIYNVLRIGIIQTVDGVLQLCSYICFKLPRQYYRQLTNLLDRGYCIQQKETKTFETEAKHNIIKLGF